MYIQGHKLNHQDVIKTTRESYDIDMKRAVKGMCVCVCVCAIFIKATKAVYDMDIKL